MIVFTFALSLCLLASSVRGGEAQNNNGWEFVDMQTYFDTADYLMPVMKQAISNSMHLTAKRQRQRRKSGRKEYYILTAYCPCAICCGKCDRITASGTIATQGRTIAVDPNVIPYGTKVHIEGLGAYVAEDCGSSIQGKRIDIFFDSHEEALEFGVQERRVTY